MGAQLRGSPCRKWLTHGMPDKVKAARFGVQWLLPEANYRWQRVMAREAILPEIS